MEGFEQKKEKHSLVEEMRRAAFEKVLDDIDSRLPEMPKRSFESFGEEYPLTCAEDCMVAFAQQTREEIGKLYDEVVRKDQYREEQALVKILRLFEAYERMVSLYAELRSYYPNAAARIEGHLPPLSAVLEHSETTWQTLQSEDTKE